MRALDLLLALAALPARAADLAEAEAAFDAGNQVRALALYEEVLRAAPDAVPALVQPRGELGDEEFGAAILLWRHRNERGRDEADAHPVA